MLHKYRLRYTRKLYPRIYYIDCTYCSVCKIMAQCLTGYTSCPCITACFSEPDAHAWLLYVAEEMRNRCPSGTGPSTGDKHARSR